MSYSQKMRSWILSGLLALVAVILWKVAQRIPTREHMEDADMSTEELILDARNRIRLLEARLNTGKSAKDIKAQEIQEKLKSLQ